MILEQRIAVLSKLENYMRSPDPEWQQAMIKAGHENGWFIPPFVDSAVTNIVENFLQPDILKKWIAAYPHEKKHAKKVGIVMAGNIPLVGFHDFLSVLMSGHIAMVKPSSKDTVLIKHLMEKLWEWDERTRELVHLADRLNNCDAYIATGSNNSAGYFEYYFRKYPHIIRRNRTSVAILTGSESMDELEKLADDVHMYFGLGCRNVTKIFVPRGYEFNRLLTASGKYLFLIDHHKYKHNYDYNLAIMLLNKKYYMTNGSLLLAEDPSVFSPISVLNYEFYDDLQTVIDSVNNHRDIQCVAGKGFTTFGAAQSPSITDYADRVDTMQFLVNL